MPDLLETARPVEDSLGSRSIIAKSDNRQGF